MLVHDAGVTMVVVVEAQGRVVSKGDVDGYQIAV